jgi:hypothetical protein
VRYRKTFPLRQRIVRSLKPLAQLQQSSKRAAEGGATSDVRRLRPSLGYLGIYKSIYRL